ncbi:hypothetical protein MtrunA17_Chr2g0278501 [Medicago truncatula]|uniref:Uncharacterized protein n=1 Tax=Medicago truncatula TaxID=3880 RepID=A0A396J485_MEDTR|nr:hypothetical protein MtrunA17_Chr2g0278501 [Medicago truncatula]
MHLWSSRNHQQQFHLVALTPYYNLNRRMVLSHFWYMHVPSFL